MLKLQHYSIAKDVVRRAQTFRLNSPWTLVFGLSGPRVLGPGAYFAYGCQQYNLTGHVVT